MPLLAGGTLAGQQHIWQQPLAMQPLHMSGKNGAVYGNVQTAGAGAVREKNTKQSDRQIHTNTIRHADSVNGRIIWSSPTQSSKSSRRE